MTSQAFKPRRTATIDLDPLSAPHIYYGESHKKNARVRTYSTVSPCIYIPISLEILMWALVQIIESQGRNATTAGLKQPARRISHGQ